MKRLVCLLGSVLLSVSCSQAPQTITTSRSTSKAEPFPDWVNRSALPPEFQSSLEARRVKPQEGRVCTLRVAIYNVKNRYIESERSVFHSIGQGKCSVLSANEAKVLVDSLDDSPDALAIVNCGLILYDGQWCSSALECDSHPKTGHFFAVKTGEGSDHSTLVTFAAQGLVSSTLDENGNQRTWDVSDQSKLKAREWCVMRAGTSVEGSTTLVAIGLERVSEPGA